MHYIGNKPTVRADVELLDMTQWPGVRLVDAETSCPVGTAPTNCVAIGDGLDPADVIASLHQNDYQHIVQTQSLDFDGEVRLGAQMISDPNSFLMDPIGTILGNRTQTEPVTEQRESVFSVEASESAVREDLMESLRQYIAEVPKMTTIRDSALIIANELLMNLMIDAPKYHLQQTGQAEMRARRLFAAHLGNVFLIGSEDAYGSLNVQKVIGRLHECYSNDLALVNMNPGEGAGLGCRMMFELSHGFVLAVEPGRKSIVCCVLPLGMSFRRQEALPKNVHILVKSS